MKNKILIFVLLAFTSCYNQKKATTQFNKAVLTYPKIPLDYCASEFPDKPDSVIVYETKTDTLWELIQFYDTTSTNDTIRITDHKTKVVTKTIWRDSIIYRENKAESQRLQLALNDCQYNNNVLLAKLGAVEKDRDEWKGKAKKKGWMFWGLIFLVIGAVGTRIYLKSKSILK